MDGIKVVAFFIALLVSVVAGLLTLQWWVEAILARGIAALEGVP